MAFAAFLFMPAENAGIDVYKRQIRLFAPVDKQKRFTGVLEAFDEEKIRLASGKQSWQIERKNIALARYVVHF